jgi:hypothetical protein
MCNIAVLSSAVIGIAKEIKPIFGTKILPRHSTEKSFYRS